MRNANCSTWIVKGKMKKMWKMRQKILYDLEYGEKS